MIPPGQTQQEDAIITTQSPQFLKRDPPLTELSPNKRQMEFGATGGYSWPAAKRAKQASNGSQIMLPAKAIVLLAGQRFEESGQFPGKPELHTAQLSEQRRKRCPGDAGSCYENYATGAREASSPKVQLQVRSGWLYFYCKQYSPKPNFQKEKGKVYD